jgi:hypothetical protein
VSDRVEFYQDKKGGWRWRLKGGNGEIVATGEAHNSRSDAVRAFEGARRLFAPEQPEGAADDA